MAPDYSAPISLRPDLRRPRLPDPATYRIRVDLDRAEPPIWRRLDVRSDVTLDVVHQVLQAAFSWDDYHLHRFSLGGGPFDHHSQSFLCPYDVDNGEFDDDGLPTSQVRLDEVLQESGDELHYVYDYGDNWELTLQLESEAALEIDSPVAALVDGERAAPPEDCGHLLDAEDLATVLDDPAQFDRGRIDVALTGTYFSLYRNGIDPRVIDLAHRLELEPVGLAERLPRIIDGPTVPSDDDLETHLRAHRWFLDRAVGDGIPLTAAGYLKPADVVEASEVLPSMASWIGMRNREVQCAPLLFFRESLQSLGLLRKHKGTLVLTRAGAAAQRDPGKLWNHLAARLLPTNTDSFENLTALLMVTYAAGADDENLPLDEIASALTELGWRQQDGSPVCGWDVQRGAARETLVNITDRPRSRGERNLVSPVAATLARAALRVG